MTTEVKSKYSVTKSSGKIYITDTKTGDVGEAYQDGESWKVDLVVFKPGMPEKKRLNAAKRMQTWYYYTQVKEEK